MLTFTLKYLSRPTNRGLIYKSISPSHRGSHVTGDVCLAPDSDQICDGVEDCVGGADEALGLCGGGGTDESNVNHRYKWPTNCE